MTHTHPEAQQYDEAAAELERAASPPTTSECAENDHDFRREGDSDGDPDVVNGTRHWCCLVCKTCGKQIDDDGRFDEPYLDDIL